MTCFLRICLTTLLFCWASADAGDRQHIVGAYQLNETTQSLLGPTGANNFKAVIPPDHEIVFEVTVPSSYTPDKPTGVMVYISPNDSGGVPKKSWLEALQAQNLIWIGANDSGNKIDTNRRITYAVLAVAALANNYQIDKSRIFLSGFSGGGRVASLAATQYPQIFKGAIYICGANSWGRKKPPKIDLIKENRYVFITGRKDYNFQDSKKIYRLYKRADITNIKFKEIPLLRHENPDGDDFNAALLFLDGNSDQPEPSTAIKGLDDK